MTFLEFLDWAWYGPGWSRHVDKAWLQYVVMIFLWVAGELLRPKPKFTDAEEADYADFGLPQVDPARPIAWIWGRHRIRDPQVIGVPTYETIRIRRRLGKTLFSGGDNVTIGHNYIVSIVMGICRATDDGRCVLKKILLDGRVIWEGSAVGADNGTYLGYFDDYDFFGERDGIRGDVYFFDGRSTQNVSAWRAALEPNGSSAYRGVAYLEFRNFWWGNSPGIAPIEIEVERYPDVLGIGNARKVVVDELASPQQAADLALPAIAYEVMTNPHLGNIEPAKVNIASFISGAARLATERNAGSARWATRQTIEEFLLTLQLQAEANIYYSTRHGQWFWENLRDDYRSGSPITTVLNEDNILKLVNFSQGGLETTINEVQVRYSDRESKIRPDPAVVRDGALYAQSGEYRSASFVFPHVFSSRLGAKLAARELKRLGYPLAVAEVEIRKSVADTLHVGSPVIFVWPQLEIVQMYMRVTELTGYGSDEGRYTAALVTDIFGVARTVFGDPDQRLSDPLAGPPLQLATGDVLVKDMPREIAALDPDVVESPAGYVHRPLVLAVAPQGNSLGYHTYSKVGTPSPNIFNLERENNFFTQRAKLAASFPWNAGDRGSITIKEASLIGGFQPATTSEVRSGINLAIIVPASGEEPEIIGFETVTDNGNGTFTLGVVHRALSDTTEVSASIDDFIWFLDGIGTTNSTFTASASTNFKVINVTTLGVSLESGAVQKPLTFRNRANKPILPAYLTASPLHASSPSGTSRFFKRLQSGADWTFSWRQRSHLQNNIRLTDDVADVIGTAVNYRLQFWQVNVSPKVLRKTVILPGTDNSFIYTALQRTADGFTYPGTFELRIDTFLNESPLATKSITTIVRTFEAQV